MDPLNIPRAGPSSNSGHAIIENHANEPNVDSSHSTGHNNVTPGCLQEILNMPPEIFTEIASNLTPGDLISLIRTNKFFRMILLRQSATPIWERVLNTMPGLPPCPTGMCEPQYAALMFSKHCTFCGADVEEQPDPCLRVRLCPLCKETRLEPTARSCRTLRRYVAMGYRTKYPSNPPGRTRTCLQGMIQSYRIRDTAEQVAELRKKFIQEGDHKGLEEWERKTLLKLATQYEEAEGLRDYLHYEKASRTLELHNLKMHRREAIYERLNALGWEGKYLIFHGHDQKKWRMLVEKEQPLTGKVWAEILPKLTCLLELNRSRMTGQPN